MAETNSSHTIRLETLSRDNYDTWVIQAEALLTKNDSWQYVSGDTARPDEAPADANNEAKVAAEAAIKKWIVADRKAKADLILAIRPSELHHVRGCVTSREVWEKLESIYASKGPARKAALLKRLTQHKMEDGDDLKNHLCEFFDALDKLKAMKIEIDGDLQSIMLLYSLPKSFENFRCAIETRDNLPNIETLKVKILEEHSARQKDHVSDSGAMFASDNRRFSTSRGNSGGNASTSDNTNHNKTKPRYKCGFCKKPGHKESECFKKKKMLSDQTSHNVEDANFCCFTDACNSVSTELWCIDSGCTSHLCNDSSVFTSAKETKSKLKLANNATADVIAKGDVCITANKSTGDKIKLKDTLYVPELRTNLMSVAKIVDHDNEVIFRKDGAVIKNTQGDVQAQADRIGDLFFLRSADESCANAKQVRNIENTWHARLGHLNIKDIRSMMKNECVSGIARNSSDDFITCKTCLAAKITSAPFGKREQRSADLLELVYSDVCGPMRCNSLGGARYFVTFIDDRSRYCQIYFIHTKDEVPYKFAEFKSLAENQTGRKIKAFQSDGGKEYCNSKMDALLKQHGIQRRVTIPHTPEQNGVAERMNRTLVETARCMLIEAGLSAGFWAEAIATAAYIRNRCTTKGITSGTPYETWTGKRPDVSHLRVFGGKVFIRDKKPSKGKFDPRGLEGTFIGYSDKQKGYRVWVNTERKVHVSRDIKFLNEFDTGGKLTDFCGEHNTDETKLPTVPATTVKEIIISGPNRTESYEDDSIIDMDNSRENVLVNEDEKDDRGSSETELSRSSSSDSERQPPSDDASDSSTSKDSSTTTVANEDDTDTSLDSSAIFHDAMLASEISSADALSGPDRMEWYDAIYKEIKSLVSNNTWILVPQSIENKPIGSRMVLRNKFNANGDLERRKARFVAQGFSQRPGIDFVETFAPVARLESLRLLLALSVKFDLKVHQLDVTTAYLKGDIDTDIYMKPPIQLEDSLQKMVDLETDKPLVEKAKRMLGDLRSGKNICRLRKAIYGLRQAGRQWYTKLDKLIQSFGFKPTHADPCVYVDHQCENTTYVLVYVDDIIITSNDDKRIDEIKSTFSSEFDVRDLGSINYCLGIDIQQDGNSITLSQRKFINEILERFGMSECKPVRTPMTPGIKFELGSTEENEKVLPYRELVGALLYIAIGTRPDIAHAVNALSQFNHNYNTSHWVAAKRILRYLQGTSDLKLTFVQDKGGLLGYTDADWGNCQIDRKSYTGYSFILSGGAVSWQSKKQRTVALSSTEAEYMSLTEGAKEGIFLINFLRELKCDNLASLNLFNDNQSAAKLAKNPVFHSKTKHIPIRFHFIRDALQNYPLELKYLCTEEMIADVLTKPLSAGKHAKCTKELGLRKIV